MVVVVYWFVWLQEWLSSVACGFNFFRVCVLHFICFFEQFASSHNFFVNFCSLSFFGFVVHFVQTFLNVVSAVRLRVVRSYLATEGLVLETSVMVYIWWSSKNFPRCPAPRSPEQPQPPPCAAPRLMALCSGCLHRREDPAVSGLRTVAASPPYATAAARIYRTRQPGAPLVWILLCGSC